MGPSLHSVDSVVEEIMRLHRSLPARPGIDEVEAAMALVHNVDKEEQGRIDAILNQNKASEVPEELFFVLQEMQKNLVYYQSKEQKREALKLLDLENIHVLFGELIQRASGCLPSSSNASSLSVPTPSVTDSKVNSKTPTSYSTSVSSAFCSEKEVGRSTDWVSKDDSFLKKPRSHVDGISSNTHLSRGLVPNSTTRQEVTSGKLLWFVCFSALVTKISAILKCLILFFRKFGMEECRFEYKNVHRAVFRYGLLMLL